MSKEKRQERILEKCVNALMKEFSTVQIVVTRVEDHDETSINWKGAGNYYARLASLKEFLTTDSQRDLASEIAEQIKKQDE